MNALHELLSRRWIVRKKDKELYYKLKDASGEYRKFLTEKLGYQMMINPHVIKVIKLPGLAEPWMGIQEFESIMEYQLLCWILIFLEDMEPDGQFLLSQLCEFLQMQASSDVLDWTQTKHRKCLVNVIRFCCSMAILDIDDGDEESFGRNKDSEVLFENMGTSKYFMRVFTQDIMTYEKPQDFERSDWINVDESRGVVRRHRVYRRLAMSMGVYREQDEDADFDYIKSQRSLIEHDFMQYVQCHLDVHRSSAYLVISSEDTFGKAFPANNSESDILLLWNQRIREQDTILDAYECIHFTKEEMDSSIELLKQRYDTSFAKKYRDMTTRIFVESIKLSLLTFGWITYDAASGMYCIYPIVGKLNGTMIERVEG